MEQAMQMLRINARGQITIPTELRQQLGISAGTVVNCIEENGRLVLIPITACGIKKIMGFLKPKPGEPSAFEELFKERARERRREDIKAAQYDAEFKAKRAKTEKIMRRYRNTLRALTK
jgi:AbrB family looped-hinge helix DNA binding protein